MNCINIIGRAENAPTISYLGPDKQAFAEFALIVEDYRVKPDINGRRPVFHFSIHASGVKAELAYRHIVAGRRIGVTGRLVQECTHSISQNQTRVPVNIVVDSFDMMDHCAKTPLETPSSN